MTISLKVLAEDGLHVIDAEEGGTILDALRANKLSVEAPCGGAGTCKKCRVMVKAAAGSTYVLSCQTKVEAGMEVVLETLRKGMVVSLSAAFAPWPETPREGLGIALDLGTTTMAACMVNLQSGEIVASSGCSNPQIAYGADVVSRIVASDEGNLQPQRELVVASFEKVIRDLLKQAKVGAEQVKCFFVAGNTVMQHLLCGLDPHSIGVAPYEPLTLFGDVRDLRTAETEDCAPLAAAFLAPCLAGYVGGDITSGILASKMLQQEKPLLLLDLGTNGEMALGDKSGAVSCATAAGPVFEGANIRFGMPAYEGAISQVRWEDDQVVCKVIGDVEAIGICGTGLIDAVAMLLDLEVIDETGAFADEDEVDEEVAAFMGEDEGGKYFVLAPGVYVTQADVRNLQLAKSAVISGIYVMLKARGLQVEEVGSLLIAGGFGEYMKLENAAKLGLFPAGLLDKAQSVGNASLGGLVQCLRSKEAFDALGRVTSECQYIELSTEPSFNEFYMENIGFWED